MRKKYLLRSALVAGALPLLCPTQQPVDLFNGRDLSGWIQRGGKAPYAIEGREIVGKSTPDTPNSFFCTTKTYGGFIALQVHGIGKDATKVGTQVRWRNLKLTELASSAASAMNTLTAPEKAAGWRQEHGSAVSFRNVKLRVITAN